MSAGRDYTSRTLPCGVRSLGKHVLRSSNADLGLELTQHHAVVTPSDLMHD